MRVIVDGNHLATRARHGGTTLRTRSDGVRSATIFGFLRIFAASLRTLKACGFHATVVWDGGRSPYRRSLYPEYKQRERKPEEMLEDTIYREQVDILRRDFLPALGVSSGSIDGVEADDIISAISMGISPASRPCVIVSGDSDFHQLIQDEVTHMLTPDGKIWREAEVLEKWGTKGSGVALAKAIIGESSDNIKGVPGIGVKRAQALIPYYEMILDQCRQRANGTADPDWKLPDEYSVKHAKLANALVSGLDIIDRNLKLISLPDFFDEKYFPDYTACRNFWNDVLRNQPEKDSAKFIRLCREWEIDDIIGEILNSV